MSAAFGYRLRRSRLSAAVMGGYEVRRVHRRSSSSPPSTWERGGSASGELFVTVTPLTQISALAAYGAANRYLWSRAGVKRQMTNTDFSGRRAVSVGLEVTAQGNRDVTTYQMGTVLELAWLGAHSSLQFRTGYARAEFPDGRRQAKPYLGIGIYRGL